MSSEKNWYIVHTRQNAQKKVTELLWKKMMESFFPVKEIRNKQGNNSKTLSPLFSSYVFVYASNDDLLTIKKTRGVKHIVFWLGQPVIVKNEDIASLKCFIHEHDNIKVEQIEVSANERSITKSINVELQGDGSVAFNDNIKKISLPSLGYALTGEVQTGSVKVINVASARSRFSFTRSFYNAAFR